MEKKAWENDKISNHLANERTFLAWVRTSVALMGFGFVIVKFAIFVRQVTLALHNTGAEPAKSASGVVGVIMVALGGLMALIAYLRYRKMQKTISSNQFYPSSTLSFFVTAIIIVACVLLMFYLLPSIKW